MSTFLPNSEELDDSYCRSRLTDLKAITIALQCLFELSLSRVKVANLVCCPLELDDNEWLLGDEVPGDSSHQAVFDSVKERHLFLTKIVDPVAIAEELSENMEDTINRRVSKSRDLARLWEMEYYYVQRLLIFYLTLFTVSRNESIFLIHAKELINQADDRNEEIAEAVIQLVRSFLHWVLKNHQKDLRLKRWMAIIDLDLLEWIKKDAEHQFGDLSIITDLEVLFSRLFVIIDSISQLPSERHPKLEDLKRAFESFKQ